MSGAIDRVCVALTCAWIRELHPRELDATDPMRDELAPGARQTVNHSIHWRVGSVICGVYGDLRCQPAVVSVLGQLLY